MQLVFTKGAGKSDLLNIHRDDGRIETIVCPKQRIIPHDMMHYAVEHTLQQKGLLGGYLGGNLGGFLGRIKEGEGASFTMQSDAQSDSVERLVEVFQGDEWSGGQSSAADLLDMYRVTCSARHCPELRLDESAIASIRASIADLTQRWAAVAIDGSLRLAF